MLRAFSIGIRPNRSSWFPLLNVSFDMDELSTSPPYAEKEVRCPRLGGPVTFEYCRVERRDLPCARAVSCWRAYFDVEQYFLDLLGPEDFDKCFSAEPQPKIVTLVELIERARQLAEHKDQDKMRGPIMKGAAENQIRRKMEDRGIPPAIIESFQRKVEQSRREAAYVPIEAVCTPNSDLILQEPSSPDRRRSLQIRGEQLLQKVVVVKLNGGRSTTMDGRVPKGILVAKDGLSYIEIIGTLAVSNHQGGRSGGNSRIHRRGQAAPNPHPCRSLRAPACPPRVAGPDSA